MSVALVVQLLAYGSCLWSMWLQGHRSRWAPWVNMGSSIPWIIMGVQAHLPSMVVFELLLLGLALRQLWLWNKH